MLLLAIDTSTPNVSAAVYDVESARAVGEREVVAANRHGELLAPLVAELIAESRAVGRIGAVAVGLGPGPFTGLRVGIATANAIADALEVPAYGCCSLDAIAAKHRGAGRDLLVVTDARRKQVYWATYDGAGSRTRGPDLAVPPELAVTAAAEGRLVVGAGLLAHGEAFTGCETDTDAPYPQAASIAQLAAARAGDRAPSEPLVPLYLRAPDARPPGPPKPVSA
jgi:tRNA threonylcarbamoyl adenosine modification protein YeaZ